MENLKLSISIMAHPSRLSLLPYLHERLGDCPESIDNGSGLWENAKRAWKMYDPSANYHAVIQDDAIICNNFMERASQVIKRSQEVFNNSPHFINFYYDKILAPTNMVEEIIKQGYITRSKVCWAVAICMPTNLIDEMITFCDLKNIPQDDERITDFMKSKGLRCYFPIPSLVDHRPESVSLVGNSGERKAWRFSQ